MVEGESLEIEPNTAHAMHSYTIAMSNILHMQCTITHMWHRVPSLHTQCICIYYMYTSITVTVFFGAAQFAKQFLSLPSPRTLEGR